MRRRDFLGRVGAGLATTVTPALAVADARPKANPIKMGQIGVGHAHAGKLSVYRESADYEVVGVVEPDAQLRKKAEDAPPYRGLKWLTRDQLLETPGLQ